MATRVVSSVIAKKIKAVFNRQKTYQKEIGIMTYDDRKKRIKKILNAMYRYRPEITKALTQDLNKNQAEVDLTEIMVVTGEAKHALRHLKKWMKPYRVSTPLALIGSRSYIYSEPKGVVLIISPWNFPINLTFGVLVTAIAAGNSVIIKPSEMTPRTSAIMDKIVKKLFSQEEIAVFQGGPEVSIELLKMPFNHIFFTGAPSIGKEVMKAAAKNLTSVTLELGGKSPTIVDETANLEEAATKIAWSKFTNNGQMCIAPDYLYVHEGVKEKLLEELEARVNRFYGKTSKEKKKSPDYSRIVNKKHFERLKSILKDALSKKMTARMGGNIDAGQKYIEPTILTDVKENSKVMKQEIFGPILPVLSYKSIDEPLEFVNKGEKPLALYIFSKDKKNIKHVIEHTRAGGGCINDCAVHFFNNNLPFGGSNNSGIGKAHGIFGFKAFSNERGILKRRRFGEPMLMMPPINNIKQKMVEFTIKYL